MHIKIAKFKLWLIIHLVKMLDISPRRRPNRPDTGVDVDLVLMELRNNKWEVVGYGLK